MCRRFDSGLRHSRPRQLPPRSGLSPPGRHSQVAKAGDCKSPIPGSNPGVASSLLASSGDFSRPGPGRLPPPASRLPFLAVLGGGAFAAPGDLPLSEDAGESLDWFPEESMRPARNVPVHPEFESCEELEDFLREGGLLPGAVLQALDLSDGEWSQRLPELTGAVLLGCRLSPELSARAQAEGALVFPELPELPFHPYRGLLYTVEELYQGFDPERPESYQEVLDARVYQHYQATGGASPPSLLETLARRLHDHAISDALEEFLETPEGPRQVVAIMGGHSLDRDGEPYAQVARIARRLTRAGFLVATGGGPGAMEASHLGAWFVERSEEELAEALTLLAGAPDYRHPRWLSAAFEVRARWDLGAEVRSRHPSLGIPTWLYGHEPPNAFATHVAKYFANSVREEGLLSIARHGVVFSPGSAGTIQEVFQDACQNHYETMGVASPMVFLGQDYWSARKPVFPLLAQLAAGRPYARWLTSTDSEDEVVAHLEAFRDVLAG